MIKLEMKDSGELTIEINGNGGLCGAQFTEIIKELAKESKMIAMSAILGLAKVVPIEELKSAIIAAELTVAYTKARDEKENEAKKETKKSKKKTEDNKEEKAKDIDAELDKLVERLAKAFDEVLGEPKEDKPNE